MKALFVSGGDFAALQFSEKHHDVPVKNIVEDIEKYQNLLESDEETEDVEIWIEEAGDVSPAFIADVRGMMDYDSTKNTYFWMENEKIQF